MSSALTLQDIGGFATLGPARECFWVRDGKEKASYGHKTFAG
jgi:hypothetical protein